jgi:hypothetical protein
LLFNAHVAILQGENTKAQEALDLLNPPRIVNGNLHLKALEDNDNIFTTIDREKSDLLMAQQMLITFHADKVGGIYSRLMGRTTGLNSLTKRDFERGRKNLRNTELWDQRSMLDEVVTSASGLNNTLDSRIQTFGHQLTDEEVEANRMYTAEGYKHRPQWGGDIGWVIKVGQYGKGKDVSGISVKPDEHEVLFPPGVRFRVERVYKCILFGANSKPNYNSEDADSVRASWAADDDSALTDDVLTLLGVGAGCAANKRKVIILASEI